MHASLANELQRHIYVVTLMLSAGAAALLIAPAAFHRVVYRQRLKQHLVQAASRLALSGLVLLLLADDGNTGSGGLAGAKTDEHTLFTGPNAVGVNSLPGK